MRLNTLKPAAGAKKKKTRLGRGMGSGLGKTCGFGHKGQKSRSGYSRKVGFEGGQMPLQRRVPKFGFRSHKIGSEEVLLKELNKLGAEKIDLQKLKEAKLVSKDAKEAKVILSGEITKAVTLSGVNATAGAKAAIEKAGGKIE